VFLKGERKYFICPNPLGYFAVSFYSGAGLVTRDGGIGSWRHFKEIFSAVSLNPQRSYKLLELVQLVESFELFVIFDFRVHGIQLAGEELDDGVEEVALLAAAAAAPVGAARVANLVLEVDVQGAPEILDLEEIKNHFLWISMV
jgi:hypothetical protein